MNAGKEGHIWRGERRSITSLHIRFGMVYDQEWGYKAALHWRFERLIINCFKMELMSKIV
jgi:hypothetical protein